jgi:hypothetical protein
LHAESVNRASLVAVFGFSLIALSTLVVALSVAFLSGHPPRPEPDEGTAAHIFQLSLVLLMPSVLVFLATANWARPGRVIRALVLPACAVVLAFGMLYYFERVATAS